MGILLRIVLWYCFVLFFYLILLNTVFLEPSMLLHIVQSFSLRHNILLCDYNLSIFLL